MLGYKTGSAAVDPSGPQIPPQAFPFSLSHSLAERNEMSYYNYQQVPGTVHVLRLPSAPACFSLHCRVEYQVFFVFTAKKKSRLI